MSELQLGLLAVGVVLVVGVFAYNWRQERAARRTPQESVRGVRRDPPQEPELARNPPPRVGAAPPQKPVHSAPRASAQDVALPDPRVDYVVEISFAEVFSAAELIQHGRANEHRYASRVILACKGGDAGWRRLSMDDADPIDALRGGLPLVTRDGAVTDAELIEFRAAVETLAAATRGSVNAPEIRPAAEAARALDQFCEESDIQVVVHVIAEGGSTLSGAQIRSSAQASGLVAEEGGRLAWRSAAAQLLYALGPLDPPNPAAVSLTLDVPRVPGFPREFESMARFAGRLAAELGGSVVDDNRNALDERAIRAIGAQLDTVRSGFEAKGIAAGSASALRLFS